MLYYSVSVTTDFPAWRSIKRTVDGDVANHIIHSVVGEEKDRSSDKFLDNK